MRIPVQRLYGKARQREDTTEDTLVDNLSKKYTILRQKALDYTDEQGRTQSMSFDITIPLHQLIIEVQHKQDDKSIMAEMLRDKIAREHNWHVCRLTEKEALSENVFSHIQREIESQRRR